jgi:hypothetical protein
LFKRALSAVLTALMLLSVAGPALAAGPDETNYAGRPMSGDWDTSCHTTIYGKVNNRPVLFYPHHCQEGGNVIMTGSLGTRLGVTARTTQGAGVSDMGWIWLDEGVWPNTPNRVFIGGTSFYNTKKHPGASVGCDNVDGNSVRSGYHDTLSTPQGPWWGTVDWVNNFSGVGCQVITTIPWNNGNRTIPSGAALVDWNAGEFIGDGWGHINQGGIEYTTYGVWRGAIRYVDDLWVGGAFFCDDAACN